MPCTLPLLLLPSCGPVGSQPLTALGWTLPLWHWSLVTGLPVLLMRRRLRQGFTPEQALCVPCPTQAPRGDLFPGGWTVLALAQYVAGQRQTRATW